MYKTQSNAEICCSEQVKYIYRFRLALKDKSINNEDEVFMAYVFTYDNNPC